MNDLAKEAEELLALDAGRTRGEWRVIGNYGYTVWSKDEILLQTGRTRGSSSAKADARFAASAPRMASLIKRLLSERAVLMRGLSNIAQDTADDDPPYRGMGGNQIVRDYARSVLRATQAPPAAVGAGEG